MRQNNKTGTSLIFHVLIISRDFDTVYLIWPTWAISGKVNDLYYLFVVTVSKMFHSSNARINKIFTENIYQFSIFGNRFQIYTSFFH